MNFNHSGRAIKPEFALLSCFDTSSRKIFLISLATNGHLIPRLIKYVYSLERIELTFDNSLTSNLIATDLNKRIFGIKFHSLVQANLKMEKGFDDWFNNPSRRNLKKNLRKADSKGLKARIIEYNEISTEVEKLELARGGNLKGFWGNFPANVPKHELICSAVYSNSGELLSITIGSDTKFTAKIFVNISKSKNDGARWLSQYLLIRHYFLSSVQVVLISDRIGLSLGKLEFQHYFGFRSANLKIVADNKNQV